MTKILIINDMYSSEDARVGQAFSDGTGYMFKMLLAQAGIPEQDYEILTAFPLSGAFESLCTSNKDEAAGNIGQYNRSPKLFLHRDHAHYVTKFRAEVERINPRFILALGDLSLWLLTGTRGVGKHRGTPMLTGDTKMICTYSPVSVIRNWKLRPIVLMDLQKAVREAADPRLLRPRRYVHLNPTLADLDEFYTQYMEPAPILSVDIETRNGQITEIGFAPTKNRALVLPFWVHSAKSGNYWVSLEYELRAWEWVRKVLATKLCLGQNYQYDMQYLYRIMGIKVPTFKGDTMLLHHSMQPEMEKGLGFLASIYTNEPSWKYMRKLSSTLKRED